MPRGEEELASSPEAWEEEGKMMASSALQASWEEVWEEWMASSIPQASWEEKEQELMASFVPRASLQED